MVFAKRKYKKLSEKEESDQGNFRELPQKYSYEY